MNKLIIAMLLLLLNSTIVFPQFSWDMPRKNLQLLPDSISGNELRQQMVSFSQSLGVRCWYCHDDSKGQALGEIDFASDKKPQKQIAREMLKMVRTINNTHISNVKKINNLASNVSCLTCHRGYSKPQHLHQVLLESYNNGGISAALKKYDELKEQYYGSFTFDFGEKSLNTFGYQLMLKNNLEDALNIFKLNAELFPESYNVFDSLGEIYMKIGNSKLSEINYKKSLELNPRNENAKKAIEKLINKP